MKAYLEYRPSDALRNSYLVETGQKLPVTRIELDRYTTLVNTHAVEVEMTDLTPDERATLVKAGEVKYEVLVGKLRGKPSISTPSDIPAVWFDPALQRRWDTIPTVAEWLAEAKAEQEAADELLPELRTAQAKWFAERLESTRERIRKATSPSTALWSPKESELKTLRSAGIDTSEYDTLMAEWESVILPALKEREAEYKRKSEERREQERIEAEAAKVQAEADKLAWCKAHGSKHLARCVENGYDCTRLYATERAAKEYPAYDLDFDNAAEWTDRSCPSPAALAEALAVGGEVVWLKAPAKNQERKEEEYWYEADEFQPVEAVVIRRFLRKCDLVRTF